MLNLSKSCQYALRALAYLARKSPKEFVKIGEIAKKEKIPSNYLGKIFSRLIVEGVVESSVGPLGGVRLSPKSRRVSIAKIVELVDGKPLLGECPILGLKSCPELESCPIRDECQKLAKDVWAKLKELKVGDFVDGRV